MGKKSNKYFKTSLPFAIILAHSLSHSYVHSLTWTLAQNVKKKEKEIILSKEFMYIKIGLSNLKNSTFFLSLLNIVFKKSSYYFNLTRKFTNYRSIHRKHPNTKTGCLNVKCSNGTLNEVQSAIAANYTWTRLSIYRVYTEWKREACKPPRQYLETERRN